MSPSQQGQNAIAALPRTWQRELAASVVQPVRRGMSGASVFLVRTPQAADRYLKIAGADAAPLRDEIERTAWLARQGIRVPEILRVHDAGGLVAALLNAMPGVLPQDRDRPVADTVGAIAGAFAALHALPVGNCPFDETVPVRLARAHGCIERGDIDPDAFDSRNQDTPPEELYRRLVATAPAREDIVVVHGDATFDNILIDDGGTVGFIDCGNAGRADRYVDLSLIATEVEEHFGAQWLEPFVRAYGRTRWDPAKARYFSDLYELF